MDEDILGLDEYFEQREVAAEITHAANVHAAQTTVDRLNVMQDASADMLTKIRAWKQVEDTANKQKRVLVSHAIEAGFTATAAGKAAGVSHVSARKWHEELEAGDDS